jgi:hypothetical protein
VIFTALLLAQLAPASTVTDELGLGAAAADALDPPAPGALDAGAAGAELPPPLLHAARPVSAATAAIPPRASWGRLLLAAGVLSLLITENSFVSLFPGRAR